MSDLKALSVDGLRTLRRQIDQEIQERMISKWGMRPGDRVAHLRHKGYGIGTVIEGPNLYGWARVSWDNWRTNCSGKPPWWFKVSSLMLVDGDTDD